MLMKEVGTLTVPELKKPPKVFDCLSHIFQNLLDHEIMVTKNKSCCRFMPQT